METKFNFNSQVCTSRSQSERLLSLGLKKETADMGWVKLLDGDGYVMAIAEDYSFIDIPAWSLHRLIEILDTNPFVFYTNCGYDTVIDHVEEYIRSGFIDTRYLEERCLNEEE